MYTYICPRCGIPSYSAVRLDNLKRPECPFCGHNPIAEVVEPPEEPTAEFVEASHET